MNHNNAAQAADTNPLSDEYVNAVIQQHGYDSPECVIARLHQWIGLHGGENGVTLLMYEAHKALSKLRAPVATTTDRAMLQSVLQELEKSESVCPRCGHGDSCADMDVAHMIRDHLKGDASAPVADEQMNPNQNWKILELKVDGKKFYEPQVKSCWGNWKPLRYRMDYGELGSAVRTDTKDEALYWLHQEGYATALASAPVAKPKRAPVDDGICWSSKEIQRRQKEEDDARAAYYHSLASAPVAGEAQPVAWANEDGDPISDALKRARPDLYGKHYTRPLVYAAPQASEAVPQQRAGDVPPLPRVMERPDWLRGYADTCEFQARKTSHGTLYNVAESLRAIADWCEDRAALSAQPDAEPLSNPKQFALTAAENIRTGAPYDDPAFEALCREHGIWGTAQSALCAVFWRQAGQQRAAGDERTAFEATYQADYDDPGAACEREHFGKGYRAGMAAQSGAQRTGGSDAVPNEPLRVFSAGMWTYDGTGQAFSHTELDEAAFITYRDALSAQKEKIDG